MPYFFTLLLGIAFFTHSVFAQSQQGTLVNRVVAIVNDDIILFSDLSRKKNEILSKKVRLSVEEEAFKSDLALLQFLINDKLLEQSIQSKGVEPSSEDIEMAYKDNLDRLKMHEAEFKEGLKNEGSTVVAFKENIKHQMGLRRLLGEELSKITVTEQDKINFYQSNPQFFAGEKKYHIKQILFASEDKLSLAKQVLEKINKGETFETLAKIHSDGEVDLGFVEASQMTDELFEQVSKLKKGASSPVFKSKIGYHIIKVIDVTQSSLDLTDDIKQKITERLTQESLLNIQQSFIQKKREESHIKILL